MTPLWSVICAQRCDTPFGVTIALLFLLCIFGDVSWHKEHYKHDWFGNSATICKITTEDECCYNYIPLQRLLCHCAFGTLPVKFEDYVTETVLVGISLPSPSYM